MTVYLNQSQRPALEQQYAEIRQRGLKINMTRGLPSPLQLELSQAFLSLPGNSDFRNRDGIDWRNYGDLQGMAEVRELFAGALLGLPPAQVAIGENSSLALMHEALAHAYLHGVPDGVRPWSQEPLVKFICPAPGYDRHFFICEDFGIQMLPVPMLDDGPDMDAVEALVANDPAIKGMWCVPKYSNPSGAVYADATVKRLAQMKTAAPDFRLFWDNAYAVHHLTEDAIPNAQIAAACVAAGHDNRVFIFASTSKIVFPGAGLAFFGSSVDNISWWLKRRARRTIGPDKLNQLRHLEFFGTPEKLAHHMAQHRALLAPKFALVDTIFTEEFGPDGIARWTKPKGGYFISLDVAPGTAKATVKLAQELGIAITPAGATYPLGQDARDSNIRIAPTFVDLATIQLALPAVCLCAKLAYLQNTTSA